MLHVNSDGGFWGKPSFRLAGVANERTNSGHAQREREALSWRIWRQSQSRTCHEIIIKTFLIVFRQIYTITYRLFKISTFNAFVKLTKAVTFLFVICQILSPMTNWRSVSASPGWIYLFTIHTYPTVVSCPPNRMCPVPNCSNPISGLASNVWLRSHIAPYHISPPAPSPNHIILVMCLAPEYQLV